MMELIKTLREIGRAAVDPKIVVYDRTIYVLTLAAVLIAAIQLETAVASFFQYWLYRIYGL